MWGKVEQTILWVVTYVPLILIMIFRFLLSNEYLKLKAFTLTIFDTVININSMVIEFIIVLTILIISLFLYKITIYYFLSGYEESIKNEGTGQNYSIRKIQHLSVNDYSFFLLTLLLPLISLDHSSVINLAISIFIIGYVISIYVKTNSISSCPLFFFSGRQIYKGVISQGTKEQELENPLLRKEVIIILKKENLDLNDKMRGEELVKDVFYLTKNSRVV